MLERAPHACTRACILSCARHVCGMVGLVQVSVNDGHLLTSGLQAMRQMAATGPTAKQQLIEKQGVYGIVWAMREHQDDVPLLTQAVHALGNLAYRGGVDVRGVPTDVSVSVSAHFVILRAAAIQQGGRDDVFYRTAFVVVRGGRPGVESFAPVSRVSRAAAAAAALLERRPEAPRARH